MSVQSVQSVQICQTYNLTTKSLHRTSAKMNPSCCWNFLQNLQKTLYIIVLVDNRGTYIMPWWTMELRRVLQIMRSAHCTMTMAMKKAVWQVYSSTLRWAYVCSNTSATTVRNAFHQVLIYVLFPQLKLTSESGLSWWPHQLFGMEFTPS